MSGNNSIGWHKDDEKDLKSESSIAMISLGCVRDFVLKHDSVYHRYKMNQYSNSKKRVPDIIKIEVNVGSLLIIKHPTNEYYYHSLPKRANVKGTRISLTFRALTAK